MGGSESKERAGDGDVIDGLFNAVAFAQCCGPVSSASTTHMVTPQAQSLMAKRRNKPDDVERQLVVGLAKRPDITNSISKGGGVSGVKLPEDKHEMYFAMVDQGQAELLDLFLIKHKNLFDVNQVNMSGDSALHIAARRSKIQVVKVLLRHGAARKRNRAGRMPEEEARDHGNSFIASLIETSSMISASAQILQAPQPSLTLQAPPSSSWGGGGVHGRAPDAHQAAAVRSSPDTSLASFQDTSLASNLWHPSATSSPQEFPASRVPGSYTSSIPPGLAMDKYINGAGLPGPIRTPMFLQSSNMSFPARASSPLPAAPPPRLMSLQGKPMPVATQPGGGSGAAGEIAVVALHSYTSSGPKPFPDDPRPELGLVRGDRLFVISISPDGWCLARRPHSALEGWLPGNFLSADGETPIVSDSGGVHEAQRGVTMEQAAAKMSL